MSRGLLPMFQMRRHDYVISQRGRPDE